MIPNKSTLLHVGVAILVLSSLLVVVTHLTLNTRSREPSETKTEENTPNTRQEDKPQENQVQTTQPPQQHDQGDIMYEPIRENWTTYSNAQYSYSIDYPSTWRYNQPDIKASNIASRSIVRFSSAGNERLVSATLYLDSLASQIEKSGHSIAFSQTEDIVVNGIRGKKQTGQIGGKGEPFISIVNIYLPRSTSSTYVLSLFDMRYLRVFERMYNSFK